MVLKEAFRYQNDLNDKIMTAASYLTVRFNVTERRQTHHRKAVNSDAEDEIVIMPKNTTFENPAITPNVVVSYMMDLYEEKAKLTAAISTAKKNAKIDIDSAISMNKTRQTIQGVFNYMSEIKSGEEEITGIANKFNVDGNQVSYGYKINEVTTIDFDRKVVKSLNKKLKSESDRVSADIDMANITVEVNYTPKYELGDSFEDSLEVFLEYSK